MKTLYSLDGMTCRHCVMSVEKEFAKLGVLAKAELNSKSVSVESELAAAAFTALKDALEGAGYALGNKIES